MSFDPMEHKPVVDEWLKMMKEFRITVGEKYAVLDSGRVSLYFKRDGDRFIYDGWSTYVGDMDIKVEENP